MAKCLRDLPIAIAHKVVSYATCPVLTVLDSFLYERDVETQPFDQTKQDFCLQK